MRRLVVHNVTIVVSAWEETESWSFGEMQLMCDARGEEDVGAEGRWGQVCANAELQAFFLFQCVSCDSSSFLMYESPAGVWSRLRVVLLTSQFSFPAGV